MARKSPIHFPGACYHVILPGTARQDIFLDHVDRYRFYLLVQEGIERFGYRFHPCVFGEDGFVDDVLRKAGSQSGKRY